jgi:hypothetical protein
MKIRSGFVSNSSSSSFCIYGIEVTEEIQEKIKKFLDPDKNEDHEEYIGHSELSEMFNYGEKKFDVKYIAAFCGESGYLGGYWSTIGDDETGKQFKDRVENSSSWKDLTSNAEYQNVVETLVEELKQLRVTYLAECKVLLKKKDKNSRYEEVKYLLSQLEVREKEIEALVLYESPHAKATAQKSESLSFCIKDIPIFLEKHTLN